jgi:hypothetical protein
MKYFVIVLPRFALLSVNTKLALSEVNVYLKNLLFFIFEPRLSGRENVVRRTSFVWKPALCLGSEPDITKQKIGGRSQKITPEP